MRAHSVKPDAPMDHGVRTGSPNTTFGGDPLSRDSVFLLHGGPRSQMNEEHGDLGQVSTRLLLKRLFNQIIVSVSDFVRDRSPAIDMLVFDIIIVSILIWGAQFTGPRLADLAGSSAGTYEVAVVVFVSKALTTAWALLVLLFAVGTIKEALRLVILKS